MKNKINIGQLIENEVRKQQIPITEFAKKYHNKMFPERQSSLQETDPEFVERFDNFAYD